MTVNENGSRYSALLGYQPAKAKDVVCNVNKIGEFAQQWGIEEQLNKGVLALCSDGALLPTCERISHFYSSCNLHDCARVEQRITDTLPPDMKKKFSDITELINQASKKLNKKDMRGKQPNERSLNTYMRDFNLSPEQKEFIGPRMKGLKKPSKVRFR